MRSVEARGDPVAALFSGVKRLPGTQRVPQRRAEATLGDRDGKRREAGADGRRKTPVRFVVERDGPNVQGYRDDLGPKALQRLRKASWSPQDTLDLHGLRAGGLIDVLAELTRERVRRGITRLLVIHGKGLHSLGGSGVLGDVVIETLTDSSVRYFVRAFRTAPPGLGGEGALVVELGP